VEGERYDRADQVEGERYDRADQVEGERYNRADQKMSFPYMELTRNVDDCSNYCKEFHNQLSQGRFFSEGNRILGLCPERIPGYLQT